MKNHNKIWSSYWNEKKPLLSFTKFTPTYFNIKRYLNSLNLSNEAKILDAGCGTGKLASFLANNYKVTGVDLSDEALDITRKKGVNAVKADILEGLPFEDGYFELVYSDGLLEHFLDPIPVLQELFRVSNKYVITFVPRIELYSTIMENFLRPPTEYKRPDSEWVELHLKLKPKRIHSKPIKFGVLAILCELD